MRFKTQVFSQPKFGNSVAENEDAHWPKRHTDSEDCKASQYRFAVADGATETLYSGLWAKILVEAYGEGNLSLEVLPERLPELQKRWREDVGTAPLPWYAEEKLKKGAFSSLVGLMIEEDEETLNTGKWSAIAIGDSCLFQVRDDKLKLAYPLETSDQFNDSPFLLSSNSDQNKAVEQAFLPKSGIWKKDDTFLLMTDALACWFLKEYEKGEESARTIIDMSDVLRENTFEGWIKNLRDAGLVRNDDVALVCVYIL